ncbi:MAG: hypothetical protein AB7S52_04340 [Sphaerochaetaceae bacterium]
MSIPVNPVVGKLNREHSFELRQAASGCAETLVDTTNTRMVYLRQ